MNSRVLVLSSVATLLCGLGFSAVALVVSFVENA